MSKETYEELKGVLLDIAGVIEKYPDNLKEEVFAQLLKAFNGSHHVHRTESSPVTPVTDPESPPEKRPTKPRPAKKGGESYQINRSLVLSNNGTTQSFKDFCEQKKPASVSDFNAVAVYYLQKILGLSEVTYNDVYTCYKEVSKPTPEAFRQSFFDTKNKQGYLDISDSGVLTMSLRGDNYVEHTLPKPPSKAKK